MVFWKEGFLKRTEMEVSPRSFWVNFSRPGGGRGRHEGGGGKRQGGGARADRDLGHGRHSLGGVGWVGVGGWDGWVGGG